MAPRIRDLVEVVFPPDRTPRGGSSLARFLLSYELGDILTRVVSRLGGVKQEGHPNCIVIGASGSGKSTVLNAVAELLGGEVSPSIHQRLIEIRGFASDVRSIVVRIGPPAADEPALAPVLERALATALIDAGIQVEPITAHDEHSARLHVAARCLGAVPDGTRVALMIDNLDRWLRVPERIAVENLKTVARIGKYSHDMPIVACLAVGEYPTSQSAGFADGQAWVASLVNDYQIEYLPSRAVRTATASHVLKKNARQRAEILEVLAELRRKLPGLECSDEEFVELYPLELSTWQIGGHLHRWFEDFSFPEFAARAADSVKGRPAISLFALSDLFSLYEPVLRQAPSLAPMLAAFDRLLAEAIPKLPASQRLWGRLAAQSVLMHSISGLAPDVKTIANSVLIYDLHDGGSSYVMMGAIMRQLEALGRGLLWVAGEGEERTYTIVSGGQEALRTKLEELTATVDDDEDTFFWTVLRFGSSFFADWPLDPSSPLVVRRGSWDVEQHSRYVAFRQRPSADVTGPIEAGVTPPELLVLKPGQPWAEAQELVGRSAATACWSGGMPTENERHWIRQWLAMSRLRAKEPRTRYADANEVMKELVRHAEAVFKRLFVENGTLVTSAESQHVADLLSPDRADNLLLRLLPVPPSLAEALAGRAGATDATQAVEPDTGQVAALVEPGAAAAPQPVVEAELDRVWLAHLTAATREEAEALLSACPAESYLSRLETWYRSNLGTDLTAPLRLLGESASTVPQIVDGLDAKQQFDAIQFYVRRAIAAGAETGVGRAAAGVFEDVEALWKARRQLEWLACFAAWVPELEAAGRYLREAEPIADAEVEGLRKTMLEWMDNPAAFSDEKHREAFSASFAGYKNEYIRRYASEHARTVGAEVVNRLRDTIIDSESWHVLEMLSSLVVGNPSYLIEAINLLSVLAEAECDVDVPAELIERPVCACGFRDSYKQRVMALASSANEFIQTGIAHHRHIIQSRRAELRQKLKAQKEAYSVETMKVIADLAKDGPLPQGVSREVIDALNELLEATV